MLLLSMLGLWSILIMLLRCKSYIGRFLICVTAPPRQSPLQNRSRVNSDSDAKFQDCLLNLVETGKLILTGYTEHSQHSPTTSTRTQSVLSSQHNISSNSHHQQTSHCNQACLSHPRLSQPLQSPSEPWSSFPPTLVQQLTFVPLKTGSPPTLHQKQL